MFFIGGCSQVCAPMTGVCSCNAGYSLIADGKSCDVNICFTNNGGCSQICTFPGTCSCNAGYNLNVDATSCDLNNCFTSNGGCAHACTFPGTCTCNTGYDLGANNKSCSLNNCFTSNGMQSITMLFITQTHIQADVVRSVRHLPVFARAMPDMI